MCRRTLPLALAIVLVATSVPGSRADTTLDISQSPLPFMRFDLKVEDLGKRTFLLYPDMEISSTLGAAPPRFEYIGPLVSADPGASQFQSLLIALASSKSKVDETKGKYAFKFTSKKDPMTGIFGFLDILVGSVDASLPTRWLNIPIVTDAAKMSGKAKRSRTGNAYDGKVKIAFSGLTFAGKAVKGKVSIAFVGAQVAP